MEKSIKYLILFFVVSGGQYIFSKSNSDPAQNINVNNSLTGNSINNASTLATASDLMTTAMPGIVMPTAKPIIVPKLPSSPPVIAESPVAPSGYVVKPIKITGIGSWKNQNGKYFKEMAIASLIDKSSEDITYFYVGAQAKMGGVSRADLDKDFKAFAQFPNPEFKNQNSLNSKIQYITVYGVQLSAQNITDASTKSKKDIAKTEMEIKVSGIGKWIDWSGSYNEQNATVELSKNIIDNEGEVAPKQLFAKVIEVSKAVLNPIIAKEHLVAFAKYKNPKWNGKASMGGQKQYVTLYGKPQPTKV